MFAIGACAAIVLASCGGSESATSRVKNAALVKPSLAPRGSCDDGEMIEGVDEDDCVITIKVGKSTRKASLQVMNDEGDWDTIDSVVAKKGGAKFEVPTTDEDGVWLDGQYTYRVFAARSGKLAEFISDDFDVVYGSEGDAEDDTAAMGEDDMDDSGTPPEMQSAMDDIEKPATKFDDNCSKIFNKIDCALMFRPGKGPDFSTLGSSKWVKMCSTLLKRPQTDCEMEFKFATRMQNKGEMQPGANGMQPGQGGGMQPGPGLDPVKLASACQAIGLSIEECRAATQMGPMAAIEKFGDKAETFCQAYGGVSCKELATKMKSGGMQPGQGGTMQPGQQGGMQPPQPGQGGTMQPGQQGGMQPPQPGQGGTMQPGQQGGMQPPQPGKG
jgi:hypothetical protein